MVIGNGIDYKVIISEYFIENGMIKAVDNKRLDKFIDIKIKQNEQSPIFMDFISIDVRNLNSIINFCNKYGLLGYYKAYHNESSKLNLFNYTPEPIIEESLLGFITEVKKMQCLIQLNEFATLYYSIDKNSSSYNNIFKKAITSLREMILFENDCDLTPYGKEFKNNQESAVRHLEKNPESMYECVTMIMIKQINSCLLSIFPQINIKLDYDTRKNHLLGYWKAPTLLSAMYYELFLKISENKAIRKCKNSTCPKYFEIIGNDTRKIYCCRECASLEAKRKERSRKKDLR